MPYLLTTIPVTTFDHLSDSFAEADIGQHPSEWHGFLCGAASGGALSSADLTRLAAEEFAADHTDTATLLDTVEALTSNTLEELNNGEYGLKLVLPDDEWPLPDRVEALAAWCQGYLSGLGQSGAASLGLEDESKSAIRDLSAIGQADTELEEGESEEQDYAQLTEYVRVAVLLIHTELCGLISTAPPPAGEPEVHH